ncbi:MAG TPA: PilZ domain-containing protein [Longimicrobiaceae bacterium]|nr:PilZ domain-containing protein [Longimicrobiaceae bacterium]
MSARANPQREFIRHTADVPIEVRTVRQNARAERRGVNVSFGGLAFVSDDPAVLGTTVEIRIPEVEPPFEARARVVHCEPEADHYCVGVQFLDASDAFRARMVEQVCSIERYRREVRETEGRELSRAEAASEWIREHAGRFPDPA